MARRKKQGKHLEEELGKSKSKRKSKGNGGVDLPGEKQEGKLHK
jgi:hypothetical protein